MHEGGGSAKICLTTLWQQGPCHHLPATAFGEMCAECGSNLASVACSLRECSRKLEPSHRSHKYIGRPTSSREHEGWFDAEYPIIVVFGPNPLLETAAEASQPAFLSSVVVSLPLAAALALNELDERRIAECYHFGKCLSQLLSMHQFDFIRLLLRSAR